MRGDAFEHDRDVRGCVAFQVPGAAQIVWIIVRVIGRLYGAVAVERAVTSCNNEFLMKFEYEISPEKRKNVTYELPDWSNLIAPARKLFTFTFWVFDVCSRFNDLHIV